jgi:hypothetical protein
VARRWREGGKKSARRWREGGKKVARRWREGGEKVLTSKQTDEQTNKRTNKQKLNTSCMTSLCPDFLRRLIILMASSSSLSSTPVAGGRRRDLDLLPFDIPPVRCLTAYANPGWNLCCVNSNLCLLRAGGVHSDFIPDPQCDHPQCCEGWYPRTAVPLESNTVVRR